MSYQGQKIRLPDKVYLLAKQNNFTLTEDLKRILAFKVYGERKLYCGHMVDAKLVTLMYWLKKVKCPACGLSWKGYMVINTDKTAPKRAIREAEHMGRMTAREFFKGFGFNPNMRQRRTAVPVRR